MKKFVQNKLKNQKGMTLIELLAVIVIIAIIAAIAIPAIGNIIENSRHNAVKADYQNALAAANLFFTEKSGETEFTEADIQGYLDDKGSLLTFTVTKPATGANTIYGTAKSPNETSYTIVENESQTNAQLAALNAKGFADLAED